MVGNCPLRVWEAQSSELFLKRCTVATLQRKTSSTIYHFSCSSDGMHQLMSQGQERLKAVVSQKHAWTPEWLDTLCLCPTLPTVSKHRPSSKTNSTMMSSVL